MLKHKFHILLAVLCLYGCKDDNGIDNTVNKLKINASVETRSVKTMFSENDDMRLFIKTEGNVSSADYASVTTATFDGKTWLLSNDVDVNDDLFVYAVSPACDATSINDIKVEINDQKDLLYSNAPAKATPASPTANLSFHHALSVVAFNIAKNEYSKDGIIKSISISGEGYYVNGTLDMASGEIKGSTVGTYTIDVEKEITTDGWTGTCPQAFAIPFNSTGKNINAEFVIDNEKYNVSLPKIIVEKGLKYVFRFILSDEGLIASPEETEIIPLDKLNSGMASGDANTLEIRLSGNRLQSPNIVTYDGESVIGQIFWGDGAVEKYNYHTEHVYEISDDYNVIINTLGASIVEFHALDKIEEIDLSKF